MAAPSFHRAMAGPPLSASKPISTIVRLRPFLPDEAHDDTITFLDSAAGRSASSLGLAGGTSSPSVLVKNLRDSSVQSRYNFAAVHPADDSQERVFESSVSPLLGDILRGSNLTLFAYGVTGSGKTWTMVGESAGVYGGKREKSRSKYSDGAEVAGEGEGITPRLVRWLMSHKQEREMIRLGKKKKARSKKGQEEDARKAAEHIDIELECYEIYNEAVFDLLVDGRPPSGLPVRENGERKVFVAGLTSQPINSYADFLSLFELANSHRSIGRTNLNTASSRSHMVISLLVQICTEGGAETAPASAKISRVNLVDLAGSENNKLTGNAKERMTESSAINKSLFVLGQVVEALNTSASRIPYRDSKMTMIMRDALGGSTSRSHGVLIANLAPGAKFYNDTVATLNFANRTRTVENRVSVNHLSDGGATNSSDSSAAAAATGRSQSATTSRPSPAVSALKPLANAALARSAAQPRPALGTIGGARAPLATKNANIRPPSASHDQAKHDSKPPFKQAVHQSAAITSKRASSTALPSTVDISVAPSHAENKAPDYMALEARLESLEKRLAEQSSSASVSASVSASAPAFSPEDLGLSSALTALLSPSTRNKTAKAAVTLARTVEAKGNVDGVRVALRHYEQALLYVPSNERLAGRIKEYRDAVALDIDLKKLRARRKREGKEDGAINERAMAEGGTSSTTATAVAHGVKRATPSHLDFEVRMLHGPADDGDMALTLPPASQKVQLSGSHGRSGAESSSTPSAIDSTSSSSSLSRGRRSIDTAAAPATKTVTATKKAQRVVKRKHKLDEDDDDVSSSSTSSSDDDDNDIYNIAADDRHAEDDDDSAFHVVAEPSSRPVTRKAAMTNRARKKVKAADPISASPPSRELSPIRGDAESLLPVHAEGGGQQEEEKGEDATESTFTRAVSLFAYDGPAAPSKTPPVVHPAAAPKKARGKRKSAQAEADPDGSLATATKSTAVEPKAKKPHKTSTTVAADAARDTSTLPPPSPPPPVALSHLSIPSIRTLVRCALCAASFPASRSGPAKLAHLTKCATELRLSSSVATTTIETEVQRLADVAVEEKRKDDEAKTLFETTIKERVVVGREVARRAKALQEEKGKKESAKAKVRMGLGGCGLESPNKETREEVRRTAERLLGLPRSRKEGEDGRRKDEDEYDFEQDTGEVEDERGEGGEKKFIQTLLSQRYLRPSSFSSSAASTSSSSTRPSTTPTQPHAEDDSIPLPLLRSTQAFKPSRLALRYSTTTNTATSSTSSTTTTVARTRRGLFIEDGQRDPVLFETLGLVSKTGK